MIFQFFYQLLWLLAMILLAPVYLYRVLVKGKYRNSTFPRLGFQKIPDFSAHKLIWLHSVSLGESQIADQLAKTLKQKYPDVILAASSCTETGQAVLKKSAHIDFCFYYPFDFNFLIKKLFHKLKPEAIIIIETDLWPGMLSLAEEQGVAVFVVNAKISQKTFKSYQLFPLMKGLLLNPVERFYIQCQSYQQRFLALQVAPQICQITGNLKLDRAYPLKTKTERDLFCEQLGLNPEDPVIVFASSHEGEEQGFINVSKNLWQQNKNIQCVFVPRHPERFESVARLLQSNAISFARSSQAGMQKQNSALSEQTCLLVDQMGLLMSIYELCTVAVVAGSFIDKVGGHNIFEPAFFSKAIIYGPWIFKQPGLHELIQEQRAAVQITDKNWQAALEKEILHMISDVQYREALGARARSIIENSRGSTEQVINDIATRIVLK